MKRQEIKEAIENKKQAIATMKNDIVELERENCLLSDERQWFTEKMEPVSFRNGGKKETKERLVGRIHWIEIYKDEDTGAGIPIERSQVVRLDGSWDF